MSVGTITPEPATPGTGRYEGPEKEPRVAASWNAARFRRHRLGILGMTLVGIVVIASLLGPVVYGIDPNAQSLTERLILPMSYSESGTLHPLGTDELGRDVLARLFAGGRSSLSVVTAGVLLGCLIGMTLGILAGFYGGRADLFLMRLVDAQLAVPLIISALVIATALGSGFLNTALALGIASWALYARLIRAETLKLREESFFDAGVALGATNLRLILRHLLPNLLGTMFIVASLEMGGLVITESSLSYLGMGMQPPDASWGQMIRAAQTVIFTSGWLAVIPGVAIMMTVLGLNLVGDWLRDILDPHFD
jgi:peptide/nickel transport system permease protein